MDRRRRRPERRGAPLAGVPLAIKDLFCTEGVPTTAGSRILEGHRPLYTATAVRQLAAAGAPMLGKTNMDEFAMGSSNENSGYGPVRTPGTASACPGGSSGGSAAAVAAGLAPWAIGTDTGGSIRQPASLCGIVGPEADLRRGLALRDGRVRVVARSVRAADAQRDRRGAAAFATWSATIRATRPRSGCPRRCALPSAHDLQRPALRRPAELSSDAEGIEPGVAEVFDADARAHRPSSAARSRRSTLPHAPHGIAAYYVIAPAEASANLARYDGVRYGLRARQRHVLDLYEKTRAQGFGAEVKRRIMLGTFALSAGFYEAYYGRAQRVRTKIADDFRAAPSSAATSS